MDKIENYPQALDFLFSFVDFSLTHQEQIAPERFELERMFQLMELLGNPQNLFSTIHIAGTKGKGSLAVHCTAALQASGLRTGLYTSPHLSDFRERIQVDGKMIPEGDFVSGMNVLREIAPKLPGVTSYELQTALAFWYFARMNVDCAAVEVGMGGRLDSTNILTPLVSVITNISYDHTGILGNTLAEIAGEKGGIIKTGVPVVSAPQHPEALAVIQQIATEKGSDLLIVGDSLAYRSVSADLGGQVFEVVTKEGTEKEFATRLLGPHQIENAVTAFASLQSAVEAGLKITDDAIRVGFEQVRWPGRFEIFPGEPTIVLDGAHNRQSARMLAETVREHFPGMKLAIIFGASADKDIAGIFAELLPLAGGLVLYQANHPRAASIGQLAALVGDFAGVCQVAGNSEEAFVAAAEIAGMDGVVLATGSLYLVGELRGDLV
jgi:dihydrofolate synthase/folylpolyglutamate synthase